MSNITCFHHEGHEDNEGKRQSDLSNDVIEVNKTLGSGLLESCLSAKRPDQL